MPGEPGRGARRRARADPGDDELERARIEAGAPRWGKELDDSILPAEAGLDETHISLHEGLLSGPGADRAAPPPREGQPPPAGARGGAPRAGRRDPRDGERSSAGSRARSRALRSATSDGRARGRRAHRRRRTRTATLSVPSARSSGDRALPCGGRGRKFESCRAHMKKPPQRRGFRCCWGAVGSFRSRPASGPNDHSLSSSAAC